MQGDRGSEEDVTLAEGEPIEEAEGALAPSDEHDKLLRSVLENDKQSIDDGRLIQEAVNRGMGSFTPDLLFEKITQHYEEVRELWGETVLREVTGHEPSSLERNVRLPEFRRLLKEELAQRLKRLQERGVLDTSYGVTDQGFLLSAYVLVRDELDHLLAAGLGSHEERERRDERGDDVIEAVRRYRDLDLRKTLRLVARRGHDAIRKEDLRFRDAASKGKVSIVYCLDASGSMKGLKLALAKRAGVALAYEAMRNADDVGLVTFGETVHTAIAPGRRFIDFVHALVQLRARRETDIASAIDAAVPLLSGKSKHLVLLSDGLHTTGSPEEVLAAGQRAKDEGVSVSVIGIKLDKEGEKLSERLTDLTGGRFYRVQNLQEMDLLILEDYSRLKR